MKKQLQTKILLCIGLVFMNLFMISGANHEVILANLITQRIDALNEYYTGTISKKEAINRINNVEGGRLLEEDILNIYNYFQTDIEDVKEYHIRNIQIEDEDEDLICAVVCIDWVVEELQPDSYGQRHNFLTNYYSVIIEKEKNSYKIVQFF